MAAEEDLSRIKDLHLGMAQALDADRKKQEINDAKMRAVAQRVDYDQFVNLVAGAHLKPVKPVGGGGAGAGTDGFNYFVMPASCTSAKPAASSKPATTSASSASATLRVPKTGLDFHKAWRRQCRDNEKRIAYLRLVDTQLIPVIFQSEFEPDIFDGIVQSLDSLVGGAELPERALQAAATLPPDGWAQQMAEDVLMAARWLSMLPEINRFSLALEFMVEETREALGRLFAGLRNPACGNLPLASEFEKKDLADLVSTQSLDALEAKFH
mmetsp:Transcript_9346/g.25446  ORF Transcript_9346/g.25446 Transcript_9346/m.25446 type:complete len:269 (+) Transcript_9346:18-824(+)|eukprot:CAMPEP_0185171378 /NCGR_PEP_ID=MMETSP1139-20130426/20117_1 /TAXON_ID=298111 /ORGANISM="Pavlova sp., Strain CCMP459" /LENGTH=268 /DNA_ID=CAMNT_0027736991 /DNA_START=24 /DNA_END=830 /DNA_ORIENTATION=+